MISGKFFNIQRFAKIENQSSNKDVFGTDQDDTIGNNGSFIKNVKIYGLTGNDSIQNYMGDNITIDAGDGNDTIYAIGGNETIFAGNGDDSVHYSFAGYKSTGNGDYGDNIYVDLGNGNDHFLRTNDNTHEISKSTITIVGGQGDDVINLNYGRQYSPAAYVNYTYGDGHDAILGMVSDDTLKIVTPVDYSTVKSNGSLKINFDDSNSIYLNSAYVNYSGYYGLNIIIDGDGKDISNKNNNSNLNSGNENNQDTNYSNNGENKDNGSNNNSNLNRSNENNQGTNSARTFYLNPGYSQGDSYKYEGGLFVTNFNFRKTSNGKNFVTFDVYNTKDANGIVEYYDENGKFLGADLIEPHSAVIKDFNSWWEKAKNTFDSIAKYGFGDVPITHPSVSTQTSIEDVPTETSKIIVTNNQAESIYAYVYNIVDNFFNGVEVIKSLKNIVQGYEAFKNSDTTQAFIDKTKGKIVEQLIHKIQETLVNLDVQGELKEFTEEAVKYETGISLLKKLGEGGIKELVLQGFDLKQAFENALEYAIENSGQVVSDQVADMAFNIGSKLFEGNPAILGLQAINLVGNSLDSLSKFITQKQLKNSKPMIFQLGVSQSSESNNLAPVNDSYDYGGGNKDIIDYVIGEKIEFRSDYSGFDFTDSDFILKSSSGDLTIKNARDKIMDVAVNGNTVAYAYMASGSGEINGSGLSPLEVIIGGNNLANQITAGSGGSSLWGGSGGDDVLTGGSGQDNFFYGKNDGSDVISNASSNDIVYLYDVSLSDITSAATSGNNISVTFNTGNNLQINSSENLSPTFNLADGNWKFNHSSGQWQGS